MFQPLHSRKMTKYSYFFYSLSIYTLIKAFIIQQTLLFLDFKTHYLIYCNMLLKITNFITVKSINPKRKNYFAIMNSG